MNVEENRLDDHLSFSPRVPLLCSDFFLIFHTRYSKKKDIRTRRAVENFERMPILFRTRRRPPFSLPMEIESALVPRIFALYVSAPVETSFQHEAGNEAAWTLMRSYGRHGMVDVITGMDRMEIHEGTIISYGHGFHGSTSGIPWFSRLQINKLT